MKTLLVILGPTGVGKTALSLGVAERLGCPILNADSRQIYKELPIGTAAPTRQEQARVWHLFVGTRSVQEDYNAGIYEREALEALETLHRQHDTVVMTGGGMMYIDAVCRGFDDIPAVRPETRKEVQALYAAEGIDALRLELQQKDPAYLWQADTQNPQRLMHALEICRETGVPYSAFRKGESRERPFRIVRIGLQRDREELYARINARVDEMMRLGLEEEARRVYPLRGLNSLNTVGYKELFAWFDGIVSKEEALRLIRQNSRHYAKRQLTWWRRAEDIVWLYARQAVTDDILHCL
ncbi:MAG: tRNA (adenosine(37)-N6)-dimethylallyltransferase MiaA [Paludibacteraceae bacterium]|nr:tRNA (adenosine(37)-N6)-dimethylallyltransferase MiaA [Paludibacteraceae bacterium]